jgi:hypothetical protein
LSGTGAGRKEIFRPLSFSLAPSYPGLGQAASLGVGKGAAELYGIPFTGWPGWLMRLCFFLHFMPSRVQAARVAFNCLTLPLFGRHFVALHHPADAAHGRPAQAQLALVNKDERES